MANKTLLNGVNELLKRVRLIQGDSGILASLTDSPRQVYIDTAVQVWNELIEEVYSKANIPLPQELGENTITLATDDRDYALQTDVVQLYFPLLDETNGRYIDEYPGGYIDMVRDQTIPANYTGLPNYAAIRPTDSELYLDNIPTSAENGDVYKYRYDKDISLSAAADTFPFIDAVFRALVPAAVELWRKSHQNSFDADGYKKSVGTAARLMTQKQQRGSWLPTKGVTNMTDPYQS